MVTARFEVRAAPRWAGAASGGRRAAGSEPVLTCLALGSATSFGWTSLGQLASVSGPTSASTFAYDARGLRTMSSTTAASTTTVATRGLCWRLEAAGISAPGDGPGSELRFVKGRIHVDQAGRFWCSKRPFLVSPLPPLASGP